VWLDVFVLRRYDDTAAIIDVIATKENGEPQPPEYLERSILFAIHRYSFYLLLYIYIYFAFFLFINSPQLCFCNSLRLSFSVALASALEACPEARFPLWHYDCRKALELWPKEFFTVSSSPIIRIFFPLIKAYSSDFIFRFFFHVLVVVIKTDVSHALAFYPKRKANSFLCASITASGLCNFPAPHTPCR